MFDWKMMMSRLLKIFDVRRIYSRIRSSVKSNRGFYIILLVYIIIMSTITIMKHNTFLTSGFDLGIFDQAFHTTLFDGKLFYETADISFNPGGSFFGVHFSPILFLMLPFYAIYPSAENLLVMQTVILALGALPIYWMSRDKFGKKLGLIVSSVYFIYPPVFLLNMNDFHLEPFTATFFIFSLYYLEKEEWRKFAVFLVLAMLTLEFAPVIGVFMGLYGLLLLFTKKFKDKKSARKYMVAVVLVSILFFLVAWKAKDAFNTYTSPLPTPFHYVLSEPTAVVDVFFSDWGMKMLYLITLLAPLAFLPLLAPETLIMTLPWILTSFATSVQAYYSVYYQYNGFIFPFIIFAWPKAFERLKLQQPKRILYVVFLSIIIFASYLPTVQQSPWNFQLPITNEHTDSIHKVLPLIPTGASVLTQNDIFPHLSNRANAYMYMPNSSDVTIDYILVDIDSPWYDWEQPSQFGERKPPSIKTIEGLADGTYGVYASAKSVLLLKRGYTGEPVLFEPIDEKFNYETLSLKTGSGNIIEDSTSSSKLVLSHDHEKDQPGRFWFGPYMTLLPGLYRATYAMKVKNDQVIKPDAQIILIDAFFNSGNDTLKSAMVNGSSVPVAGQWFNRTLLFAVKTPIKGVECRGEVWGNYSVSLDYVRVEQLVAQSISETLFYKNAEHKSVFYSEELSAEQGVISDGEMTHVKGGIMTHVKGSGTFWHGPYVSLPRGSYIAKFWLKLDEPYNGTDPLLDLDVTTNAGKDELKLLTLKRSNFETIDKWQSFEIKFTLQNSTNIVEFRGINVEETAPISLLSIEVYEDTSLYTPFIYKTTFNYENLLVEQGTISNGTLTHSVGNGTFWHGPYTTLPKGEYMAKFWLKLDKPYNGTLLDLDVAVDAGKQLKFLTLSGFNFGKINEWQGFEINFTLQNDVNIVEFRGIYVRETAPISLLSIELYQNTGLLQQPLSKTYYSEDLIIDQAIAAKNGTFWHGPYTTLPKGDYMAKFWLKLDKPYNGTLLDLEVATNSGNKVLTALTVHSSNFEKINDWQGFEVKFTLQDNWNIVELRGVKVRETAPISLLAVEVYPDAGQPHRLIYNTEFNYEDLTVEQGKIDNGTLTHSIGNGTFWHGPYVSLPKGNYAAKFWLKLNKPYNGTLLDVDVSIDPKKDALTFLTLSGSNFATIDKWQGFEVKFTLQNDTNIVEFRGVNVKETAPISLRSIEVYPDTGISTQQISVTVFYIEDLSIEQGTFSNDIVTHTKGNGTFWHGPYATLAKGNYAAKFWLKLDKPYNGTLLDIDVATNSGNNVLTALTVHSSNFEKIGEWQSFEVKFTLQDNWNIVEFRGIYVRETAPISLRSIEVYPDTDPSKQLIYKTEFNYEDLTVEQGAFANGTLTHSTGNGTFWHGPYTTLPKGEYMAKFWLKLDKPYNGTLLDLDVAVDAGNQLKFLTLSGFNFGKINEWQSFEIKFTLQNDTNIVEFRGIYVKETAPISLRSIEVYPDTGG